MAQPDASVTESLTISAATESLTVSTAVTKSLAICTPVVNSQAVSTAVVQSLAISTAITGSLSASLSSVMVDADNTSSSDEDIPLANLKQSPTVGDFVLVLFKMGKNVKYYVGKILQYVVDDGNDNNDTENHSDAPYQVKFMRQSHKVSGQFCYPTADDIWWIGRSQILRILASMKYSRRGDANFGKQLAGYIVQ